MEYRSTKEEIIDKIYHMYADDLYKACLYLTQDEKQAQDIMLQTLLEVYKQIDETNMECTLEYLIYKARRLASGQKNDSKELRGEAM